jgi:hypothetical protein
MKIRSARKTAKQKPDKSFVKTATAFETSAVISIRPYQRQRFKISSSGKYRHRTAVWSPSTHGRSIRKHCSFWQQSCGSAVRVLFASLKRTGYKEMKRLWK